MEVEEAKRSSFSGAQGLQEKLRAAEEGIEILRLDHATLHRQSQARQAELESANTELVEAIYYVILWFLLQNNNIVNFSRA